MPLSSIVYDFELRARCLFVGIALTSAFSRNEIIGKV